MTVQSVQERTRLRGSEEPVCAASSPFLALTGDKGIYRQLTPGDRQFQYAIMPLPVPAHWAVVGVVRVNVPLE